jgi:hypothetical protein
LKSKSRFLFLKIILALRTILVIGYLGAWLYLMYLLVDQNGIFYASIRTHPFATLLVGLLALAIMAVLGLVLLGLISTFNNNISFPGTEIQKIDQPPIPKSTSEVKPTTRKDLLFVTDGVGFKKIHPGAWSLSVYFSVYNVSPIPLTIFDLHAHVYGQSTSPMKRATIDYREKIELLQTNSIVANGKTYPLAPGENMPMELVTQVSTSTGMGNDLAPQDVLLSIIFGLFVDYRILENGALLAIRIPSDSVYYFENSDGGQFLYINPATSAEYLERKKKTLFGQFLIYDLGKLLDKHSRLVSKLSTLTVENLPEGLAGS